MQTNCDDIQTFLPCLKKVETVPRLFQNIPVSKKAWKRLPPAIKNELIGSNELFYPPASEAVGSLLKSGKKKFHHPYSGYPWMSVTLYSIFLQYSWLKFENSFFTKQNCFNRTGLVFCNILPLLHTRDLKYYCG